MHGNTSNEFPALSPVGGIVLTEAGLDGDALIDEELMLLNCGVGEDS